MTSPPAEVGAKAPDLAATAVPLITAIITALGAWKLFEPKWGRIRAIKTEMGRLEPGFRALYVAPQVVLAFISGAIAALLLAAFWLLFSGNQAVRLAAVEWLAEMVREQTAILLALMVLLMGVMGAIIYSNVLSHLLLVGTRLLSWLPIPWLRGRFGPSGSSAGWHQTRSVCQGPDKGAPLLIDREELKSFSSFLLGELAANAGSVNLADVPAELEKSVKANIALFGCILEAEHYAHGWPSPQWSQFYDALADIQADNGMFAPEELALAPSDGAYFETLRIKLDEKLKAGGQPRPPQKALQASESIGETWRRLKQDASGDLLKLPPWYGNVLGSQLFWLDRRLRAFPRLQDDGMRPQLLKLLLRWKVLPVSSRGTFVQPFAKRQAWALFHERVLRSLPELNEVTFNGTGEAAIARLAALLVARQVATLVQAGGSAEARTVQDALGNERWELEAAADFIFWDWAGKQLDVAKTDKWDKEKWPWKFENGRVSRQG